MRNLVISTACAVAVAAATSSAALLNFHARAATADDDTCRALTSLAHETNARAPRMLNSGSRDDGIALSCSARTVLFKYSYFATEKQLEPGWRERTIKQFNAMFCEGAKLESIRRGWTIAISVTFQDGARFWHKATCIFGPGRGA